MTVSAHVNKLIAALLDQKRILVWYDGERAFEGLVASFSDPDVQVVRMTGSRLLRSPRSRRKIQADRPTRCAVGCQEQATSGVPPLSTRSR